jgi:hypothetical protein
MSVFFYVQRIKEVKTFGSPEQNKYQHTMGRQFPVSVALGLVQETVSHLETSSSLVFVRCK